MLILRFSIQRHSNLSNQHGDDVHFSYCKRFLRISSLPDVCRLEPASSLSFVLVPSSTPGKVGSMQCQRSSPGRNATSISARYPKEALANIVKSSVISATVLYVASVRPAPLRVRNLEDDPPHSPLSFEANRWRANSTFITVHEQPM